MNNNKDNNSSKFGFVYQLLIIFCAVSLCVTLFGVFYKIFISETQNYRVEGNSMYYPLHDGDVVEADMGYEKLERFDIVIFEQEVNGLKHTMIKRVIGLPNEKVSYKEGQLYIDGKVLEEPYAEGITYLTTSFDSMTTDDCYFLMGDNRRNSTDSRVFGCVPKERILGVVVSQDSVD